MPAQAPAVIHSQFLEAGQDPALCGAELCWDSSFGQQGRVAARGGRRHPAVAPGPALVPGLLPTSAANLVATGLNFHWDFQLPEACKETKPKANCPSPTDRPSTAVLPSAAPSTPRGSAAPQPQPQTKPSQSRAAQMCGRQNPRKDERDLLADPITPRCALLPCTRSSIFPMLGGSVPPCTPGQSNARNVPGKGGGQGRWANASLSSIIKRHFTHARALQKGPELQGSTEPCSGLWFVSFLPWFAIQVPACGAGFWNES